MAAIQAVYFGNLARPYIRVAPFLQLAHAWCDHASPNVDQLNKCLPTGLPQVTRFVSKKDMVEQVQAWPVFDLLLVAGFSYRLPQEVIGKFKRVINIHTGDTADNRGPMPVVHDVLLNKEFWTITIHLIDSEEFDSGPILSQLKVPIDWEANMATNMAYLDSAASLALADVVERLSFLGSLPSIAQHPTQSDNYKPRVDVELIREMFNAKTLADFRTRHLSVLKKTG